VRRSLPTENVGLPTNDASRRANESRSHLMAKSVEIAIHEADRTRLDPFSCFKVRLQDSRGMLDDRWALTGFDFPISQSVCEDREPDPDPLQPLAQPLDVRGTREKASVHRSNCVTLRFRPFPAIVGIPRPQSTVTPASAGRSSSFEAGAGF
jgi:hypothetical protein